VQLASQAMNLAPVASKKATKRKRSKQRGESDDSDASESDCGGESDGEDAQERAAAAVPTKRNVEADWTEAQVTTDIRELKQGHLGKRAHLRRPIQETEEPILGLFLRFFPIGMYEEHLEMLRDLDKKGEGATSRHAVKWDKGTFLKFLGLLIRFTATPLSNVDWHWRWPHDVPEMGLRDVKHIMSEAVFKKMWQKATVPGVEAEDMGEEEDEVDPKSAVYKAMESLVEECADTWQTAWVPGDYIVADECMIFWQGTGEIKIIYQGRKPTSFGIELKSLACGEANVMLNIELVEGAVRDSTKAYRD
jgi:hypothetical protein